MRRIRNNAQPHHWTTINAGQPDEIRLYGGQTAIVDAELAVELATQPGSTIEIVDEPEPEEPVLEQLKRAELNELAESLGVESPGDLPNKDAVIAAIREAEAGEAEADVPEAEDDGEGLDDNPDSQEE